jgi:hypothetical protein
MKTAILIHGCHVDATNWENIMWGDPARGVFGRVPRALQLLNTEHASLLCWGTGASERDGVKEAQYIFDYTVKRVHALPQFNGKAASEVVAYLLDISHIDVESQNTSQEVEAAARACKAAQVERLILVSSPTHISRCLLEAEKLRAVGGLRGIEVFATSSDTCYADSTVADVLIVEPPHRGDRSEVPTSEVLRRVMRRLRDKVNGESFWQELEGLLGR